MATFKPVTQVQIDPLQQGAQDSTDHLTQADQDALLILFLTLMG